MGGKINGASSTVVSGKIFDAGLLQRLHKGDRDALSVLFDHIAPMLLATAMRYLANRQDAEDVMQESLLKVLQSLDSFTPLNEKSFEAWTKKICVNHSLNVLRKKSRFIEVSDHETERIINKQTDDAPEDASLPEQIDPGRLLEYIAQLPSGYRTVMNLYVFEGLSHKEIAETLGISENTSKTQLHKARKFLKTAVSEYSTIKMP